jgi:hypothetical protein
MWHEMLVLAGGRSDNEDTGALSKESLGKIRFIFLVLFIVYFYFKYVLF